MGLVKDLSIQTFQRLFAIENGSDMDNSQDYDLFSQAIGNVLFARNGEQDLSVEEFFEVQDMTEEVHQLF